MGFLFVTGSYSAALKDPTDDSFLSNPAIQSCSLEPILDWTSLLSWDFRLCRDESSSFTSARQCYAGIAHARGRKKVSKLAIASGRL